jgi:hypothetical protein
VYERDVTTPKKQLENLRLREDKEKRGFFYFLGLYSTIPGTSSTAPQISPCRGMLGSNQDSSDYTVFFASTLPE